MTKVEPISRSPSERRVHVAICALIFLVAFGVRVLSWHDTRLEVGKVQTAVTADYQRVAQLLREGGVGSLFSSPSPLADLNNLGHPPGYSILLALIFRLFGQSDSAVQFVQIFADALAAVFIFLIVAELLPLGAGVIAGSLAALSPQFAWNSVLLLPDSISVLPILVAIYLLARATRNSRLVAFLIVGALVGISCWLRANAMLLTFFIAAAVPLLRFGVPPSGGGTPNDRQSSATVSLFVFAVILGTLLIVLPLTIRNAIVFHRFIPLSLGAGQTLLEGIADYDTEGRFGIPRTDVGIMKQEAEIYQRPDYYGTLFNPDGVERERARLSRGFAIIRSNPFWFVGVMTRRASSMVRLERSRLISTQTAVTHRSQASGMPDSVLYPKSMVRIPEPSDANVSIGEEQERHGGVLRIVGNGSRYDDQAAWPLTLHPNSDYLVQTAVKVERGRMRISIVSSSNRVLASSVVDALEQTQPEEQPYVPFDLAFVSDSSQARIVVSNEASNVTNPALTIAPIAFYDLGPARLLWTRYPRFVIHAVQKIFITAVMLPLAIIGLLIVIVRNQRAAFVILLVVPLYCFTVQSIVHTEYRYVLAVDYFLFAFVGVAISSIIMLVNTKLRSFRAAPLQSNR